MKLRKREIAWLVVLGAVLLAVRGMDARTTSLRRQAREAREAATDGATAESPAGATALPAVAADAGGGPGELLAAADLAALPWGPNPFRRPFGGPAADDADGGADGGEDDGEPEAPDGPPVFQGVARVGGRDLAALDGAFRAVGERVGPWRVEEIAADAVTLRNLRSGAVRRLVRGMVTGAR